MLGGQRGVIGRGRHLLGRGGNLIDGQCHVADDLGGFLHHLGLVLRAAADLLRGAGHLMGGRTHLLGGRRKPLRRIGHHNRRRTNAADQSAQAVAEFRERTGHVGRLVRKIIVMQFDRLAQIALADAFRCTGKGTDIGAKGLGKDRAQHQTDQQCPRRGYQILPPLRNAKSRHQRIEGDRGGHHDDEPHDKFVGNFYPHRFTPCSSFLSPHRSAQPRLKKMRSAGLCTVNCSRLEPLRVSARPSTRTPFSGSAAANLSSTRAWSGREK